MILKKLLNKKIQKNQIILIGVSASVLLLFFMIVFKSDKDHAFLGTSKISIYVENGGNLSNSESLLQLIDIYSDASLPVKFTALSLIDFFLIPGGNTSLSPPVIVPTWAQETRKNKVR